ncbi:unnamed protein product [Candidula unifasciata]|uniref:Uncharacterized protein n=1 Tax=Candidula unifasciata TaxID=100452 RepID=A0A8S3ZGR9_9EUPU|nr:unnamed protein product [Candidula unifasciata]
MLCSCEKGHLVLMGDKSFCAGVKSEANISRGVVLDCTSTLRTYCWWLNCIQFHVVASWCSCCLGCICAADVVALAVVGCHEVEVEADGQEASFKWEKCQKNVGHVNFIKPVEFSMSHLPAAHDDDDIYTYIKLWSQLVVRLKVNYISRRRHQGYAFHNFRGRRTGKVAEISTVTNSPCPCPECRNSNSPKTVWKAIWIMSAMHVVFDDSEVVETDAELFYDEPDNSDGVRKLHGVRIVDANIRGDWSKFECATHDLELGQLLEDIDAKVLQLGEIIREKHLAHKFPPLAVIASHPHGCSKRITVGQWTDRKLVKNPEENYEWTEYVYTTSTCTGCSGAPVWIIGPQRDHYSYNYYSHVHSEGLKSGLNKSGAGDVEKRWDEN